MDALKPEAIELLIAAIVTRQFAIDEMYDTRPACPGILIRRDDPFAHRIDCFRFVFVEEPPRTSQDRQMLKQRSGQESR